ncbi:MAG: glucose-6-phosphate isomerase [Gammaproteobacteria bacterium]|nr:glucose-6-phosphate isomerase [Gammaproteobacteria bacterium]
MPPRRSSAIAWKKLQQHQKEISRTTLSELFAANPRRAEQLSIEASGLFLDYSKNLIDDKTLALFDALAEELGFAAACQTLRQGSPVNHTENRSALHTALRGAHGTSVCVNGADITPNIQQAKAQMAEFVDALHRGNTLGGSGKPILDVVNIGIGGSYLGPKMVVEALTPYQQKTVRCHFIANIDGTEITEVLENLNPETTLFIIASKSFSTKETLCNAVAARTWVCQNPQLEAAIDKHFVAVSSNIPAAIAFGIKESNVFPMWDWVGGRYSLWSTIGLPIAIAVGMTHFQAMLDGAHEMDQHFFNTKPLDNMPFLLAMLQVWYNNFFAANSHAVIPYDHDLRSLPEYLQQLEMESNGKCVDSNGTPVDYATGSAIWGGAGTNGQHAYHQLFHQGTQLIPVDFIFPLTTHNPVSDHHAILIANCLSQSRAMLVGKTLEQATEELLQQGLSHDAAKKLAPHKVIPGNRPSNTLTMEELSPARLGALIALYEHKVYTQSIIWDINAFDQWGVELGKQISSEVYQTLTSSDKATHYDPSTNQLIKRFKAANRK